MHMKLGTILTLAGALTMAGFVSVRADEGRPMLVQRVASKLENLYVFPDRARVAAARIRSRLAEHAYDAGDGPAFAMALTADLFEVLHDKHVRVGYSESVEPPDRDLNATPSAAERAADAREAGRRNFGFVDVQMLAGNIGYVELRRFDDATLVGPTMAAAMQFVANADAVIIDERHNGGGDSAAVAMLVSYFFRPGAHILVNDFRVRVGDKEKTEQSYTHDVAGPHFARTPLYVLTSARTFSGAEEFAYDVQTLRRGTIVGETTGGAANPGHFYRLGDHFNVFIPTGRAINPITQTNWEGVGVKPDVAVTKEEALKAAYLAALRGRLASVDPAERATLMQTIADVEKTDAAALPLRP
jgi:hypothetical protein